MNYGFPTVFSVLHCPQVIMNPNFKLKLTAKRPSREREREKTRTHLITRQRTSLDVPPVLFFTLGNSLFLPSFF